MLQAGTVYRRAVDVLRTATEPLTAREIAERVLAAANVANPDKDALADLACSVLASLRNHKGKGVRSGLTRVVRQDCGYIPTEAVSYTMI
jgi:hypothetical protein